MALLPTRSLSGCRMASIWDWRKPSEAENNRAARMVAEKRIPVSFGQYKDFVVILRHFLSYFKRATLQDFKTIQPLIQEIS